MKKVIKVAILLLLFALTFNLISCQGYKTKDVISELEIAFEEFEKGDASQIDEVLEKYRYDNIDKNRKIKSLISSNVHKYDFYSVIDLLVLFENYNYDFMDYQEISSLIIQKFDMFLDEFMLDEVFVEAIEKLDEITHSSTIDSHIETAIINNVALSNRLEYMNDVSLEIVLEEELIDYVLNQCKIPAYTLHSKGYYGESDEYSETWGTSTISGIYTESGLSYGDFFIKRKTKRYLDPLYQECFNEDKTLYFRGEIVQYGRKLILVLEGSYSQKIYYDEYNVYLYSPNLRDIEVYKY